MPLSDNFPEYFLKIVRASVSYDNLSAAFQFHDRKFHAQMPSEAVSYTHLRAHETVLDLVCRLLLEKKKIIQKKKNK